MRLTHWPQLALYAGSVVLVLVALGGFLDADSNVRGSTYSDVGYNNPYGGVEDLFIYDERGKLITNARVFDQNGDPLRIGTAYCYDEQGNVKNEVTRLTYPYCPERDPFRLPVASASADPAPSEPTDGPGPMPESDAGVSPSAKPSVGPSASSSAISPSPR